MTRPEVPLVLGVSAHYHDSAAALVRGQQVVAAAQEERFTRVKGDASLPANAIRFALERADVHPDELTAVVFYEDPQARAERILATHLTGDLRTARAFNHAMRSWLPEKLWVDSSLRRILGRRVPVVHGDHHLSHAASAYYPSPHDDAAILTIDGVGEWSTTTVGHGRGTDITLHEHIEYPNSLGLLYSAFTLYCGFRINSGEYKLMGLAPYGRPVHAQAILDEVIDLRDDGSYALNPAYFAYHRSLSTYTPELERLLGGPGRKAESTLTQHHADVAASIQTVLDRAVLALARRAKERTGSRNLCLAGGVALNVVSVGRLRRAGLYDDVWVQPAAGDAGGALGAALWAAHMLHGAPRIPDPDDSMRGAFLGPTPTGSAAETARVLSGYGLTSSRHDDTDLAARVAGHLAEGRIVAVARGRMEYGPRALGARSILADARDPGMQRRLNLATKFREGFRPFAPMVLAEHADDWFETGGGSDPYMLGVMHVRDEHRVDGGAAGVGLYERASQVRSRIPAVTHVDHSARVQTVDARRNPFMHQVLTEFAALTGVPVVVNTSFNVRGEPIVCDAEDAVECFLAADIDVLVVDDHVVVRSDQDPGSLRPRRASARGDD